MLHRALGVDPFTPEGKPSGIAVDQVVDRAWAEVKPGRAFDLGPFPPVPGDPGLASSIGPGADPPDDHQEPLPNEALLGCETGLRKPVRHPRRPARQRSEGARPGNLVARQVHRDRRLGKHPDGVDPARLRLSKSLLRPVPLEKFWSNVVWLRRPHRRFALGRRGCRRRRLAGWRGRRRRRHGDAGTDRERDADQEPERSCGWGGHNPRTPMGWHVLQGSVRSLGQVPIFHLPRVVEHVPGAAPDQELDRPPLPGRWADEH